MFGFPPLQEDDAENDFARKALDGPVTNMILRDMPQAVLIGDKERTIRWVNPATEALFNCRAEDIVGRNALMLYARSADYVKLGQDRYNFTGNILPESYRADYRRADGSVFPSETIGSGLRDSTGALIGTLVIVREIGAEVRFNDFVDSLRRISVNQSLDFAARIREILSLGSSYFGLGTGLISEIDGNDYTIRFAASQDLDFQPGQTFDLQRTYCASVYETDAPLYFQDAADSDFSTHPGYLDTQLRSFIGTPLHVDGTLYGTVCFSDLRPRQQPFERLEVDAIRLLSEWVANSLSSQRRIEALTHMKDEAERMREQAETGNRAKTLFLANMSHELRTPLNAILGMSEMIAQRLFGDDIDRYASYAADIHKSGTHLLDLIEDLLDLSRLESGGYRADHTDLDLSDVLHECRTMLTNPMQRRGTLIDIPDDLPQIRGDARAIRQIGINLMSNSIKYAGEKAVLTIQQTRTEDGDLCLRLRDTGPGLPDEIKARAMEPFVTQNTMRYDDFGASTGLGLAITARLMKEHDGTIALDNHPDGGLEVTLTFPKARIIPTA
jgi:PAS domain S-box-containing protein